MEELHGKQIIDADDDEEAAFLLQGIYYLFFIVFGFNLLEFLIPGSERDKEDEWPDDGVAFSMDSCTLSKPNDPNTVIVSGAFQNLFQTFIIL